VKSGKSAKPRAPAKPSGGDDFKKGGMPQQFKDFPPYGP
jgi:hypothetical protein